MIKGAMTALITPFKNGKVDEEVYAKLIERQIRLGIDVVVPVGTTGESATLSHNEHKKCIEIAVEVCKNSNTSVLAGAGSNSTMEAIDLATFAQNAGANGVLSVTPYYNKPTQEGLYQHYKAIANSIEIPLILYNVPGRTGVDLKPKTVIRLFENFKNIIGIKEASGDIDRIIDLVSSSQALSVISGDDAINYPILSNGGNGVISVTSNLLPDQISKLTNLTLNGDYKDAQNLSNRLYELNKVLFIESNPIPIKAIMYLAGLLSNLEYRLPLVEPSSDTMKKLEDVLSKYEVIK